MGSDHRSRHWPRAGWPPAVPALGTVAHRGHRVIRRADYDRRTRARLRSLADARFGSLLDRAAGRFCDGGHPADVGELLRRNVVLAVHDIGAAEDRTFVTGALLVRLAEYLRARRATGPADRLRRRRRPGARALRSGTSSCSRMPVACCATTGPDRPATHAAERFAALLAEFGARGEGIVLAEQRPALLVPDVARSTAVRIVHRMAPAGGGQAWHRPLGAPEVAVMAAERDRAAPLGPDGTHPPALDSGGRRAGRRCPASGQRPPFRGLRAAVPRSPRVPPGGASRVRTARRFCRTMRGCAYGPRRSSWRSSPTIRCRPFRCRCGAAGRASVPGRANACWPRSLTAGSGSAPWPCG